MIDSSWCLLGVAGDLWTWRQRLFSADDPALAFLCLYHPLQWFKLVFVPLLCFIQLIWLVASQEVLVNVRPLSLLSQAPFPSLVDPQAHCWCYFLTTTDAHLTLAFCCCHGCLVYCALLVHSFFWTWVCSHVVSRWAILRPCSRRFCYVWYVSSLTFSSI